MDLSPEFLTGWLGVLLAGSFIRFAVVLTVLRWGLGLRGMTFGFIATGLALVLSAAVLEKDLSAKDVSIFRPQTIRALDVEATFRPLVAARTDKTTLTKLKAQLKVPNDSEPTFGLLLSGYILSELQLAFGIAIVLLLPFVVIDLLAAHLLILLNIQQMPAVLIALPLKLLVFFAIDGWTLLGQKLLGGIAL